MPTRKTGLDVSVFTLEGGNYLGELKDATLTVNTTEEDASGVADTWDYPWATGKNWQLSGDFYVAAAAGVMSLAGTQVTVAFTTGANAYGGDGLMTEAEHHAAKRALQTQRCTIKGQGALTITAPS